MSKTFRYYTILRPLRDRYLDDSASVLALVPITDEGRATDVALIGSPGDPRMIRVSVTGIDYEERKRLDDLTESMLALLRVFCDNEISLGEPRFRYANLLDDGLPPDLNIEVRKTWPAYALDSEFAVSFMHSDKAFRDIVRLYATATSFRLSGGLPIRSDVLASFMPAQSHLHPEDYTQWNGNIAIGSPLLGPPVIYQASRRGVFPREWWPQSAL
jgi:hypothetical protein